MAFDLNRIEERIDKVVSASIELDENAGISMKRLVDAMEVAKLMAISGPAVPLFMQGEPGICYAAVVRAVRWNFDPFFVAEMMYLTKNRATGETRIAFMAQLINAVINAHAPLEEKLYAVYTGEGNDLMATIYGLPRGSTKTLDYETPTLGKLIEIKGRNEAGYVKGSPLYDNDPKQQLWYYGTRGFCRRHFPEVLAGIPDQRDDFVPVDPKDVSPGRAALSERLKHQRRITSPRGFNAQRVASETSDGKPAAAKDDPAVAVAVSEPAGSKAASPEECPPTSGDAVVSETTS